MFKQSIRSLATKSPISSAAATTTTASTTSTTTTASLNFAKPPSYTLAQLREFPSLEPKTFIPLPTTFFNTEKPIRRDILWSCVTYEADKARVGSNYAILKSDSPYSNRKLRPQKGSGRARLGDANSPHMDNEIKAHAIKGPHDWSTDLPSKIYSRGIQNAFTMHYKQGNLNVVENELDFQYGYDIITQLFVSVHNLNKLNLLFITNEPRDNLIESIKKFYINEKEFNSLNKKEKPKYLQKLKGKVLTKEDVEVRDILRAHRVFIESSALQWFITKHTV